MKNLIPLVLLTITLVGCSPPKAENNDQPDSMDFKLEGNWRLSESQYKGEKTSEQLGCPALDGRIEDIYQPRALGAHLLIKDDSISVFRYPYAYYGTFKYEIIADSLFIESDYPSAHSFSLQKTNKDNFSLTFVEGLTSTCPLSAEARYTRFSPDSHIINKLIQDSIACDSLVGKWWYLRKEITYEDGMDPTILNFPKGMPDSIFVSQEIIEQDVHKPYIALELDNRIVKLLFKNPYENSFTLTPEINKNAILFSNFIEDEERIDTVYYEVIYRR